MPGVRVFTSQDGFLPRRPYASWKHHAPASTSATPAPYATGLDLKNGRFTAGILS